MITQRRIQHLLTLVEHAHFGRAAQALHISQPALSKSIQALEAELGVALLDRQRSGVVLTTFGELVVQRGRSWLTAEEDLRREIAMLAGAEIGSIKVALGPYPGVMSGFTAAASLLAQHPDVRMTLHQANWVDILHRIDTQAVDLGITEISGLGRHKQLATELLGQHRGYFFCRPDHPLTTRQTVRVAQLLEFPWVSPRLPARSAVNLPRAISRAGTVDAITGDLIPAIEVDAPLQLARFVKNSDAIAPATLTVMEQALQVGEVAVLPVVGMPLHTHYGFVYLQNRSLPPAATAYMQAVRVAEQDTVKREAELAARFGLLPSSKD